MSAGAAVALPGPRGDGYIMEHDGEARRLEQKTDRIATMRQLAAAGLRPGMAAVDIGCGSGAVTRVMAGTAGARLAVGIDRSPARITAARALARVARVPAEFAVGEVTRLPVASASFDFAWSRFLFEYLPDPAAALAEMIRGHQVRVASWRQLADLDGQITGFHPLDDDVRRGLDRCLLELAPTGFDPNVGRKLYSWFTVAGLADIRVDVQPYQVYAGGIPADHWPNWDVKLRIITELLADRTGDRAYWRWFRDAMGEQLRRPDLFYHSTLVIVTGRKPRADVRRS